MYISENFIFQKKKEANKMKRIQNNIILFNTSENIYIF